MQVGGPNEKVRLQEYIRYKDNGIFETSHFVLKSPRFLRLSIVNDFIHTQILEFPAICLTFSRT